MIKYTVCCEDPSKHVKKSNFVRAKKKGLNYRTNGSKTHVISSFVHNDKVTRVKKCAKKYYDILIFYN